MTEWADAFEAGFEFPQVARAGAQPSDNLARFLRTPSVPLRQALEVYRGMDDLPFLEWIQGRAAPSVGMGGKWFRLGFMTFDLVGFAARLDEELEPEPILVGFRAEMEGVGVPLEHRDQVLEQLRAIMKGEGGVALGRLREVMRAGARRAESDARTWDLQKLAQEQGREVRALLVTLGEELRQHLDEAAMERTEGFGHLLREMEELRRADAVTVEGLEGLRLRIEGLPSEERQVFFGFLTNLAAAPWASALLTLLAGV